MDPITITCPGCGERVVAVEGLVCPRCGASVAAQVFEAQAAQLAAITARARAIRPPKSGGGTVNGSGTTLLHYRPRGDGTWDALKWFTFAWLPIVPLRSLHIRPVRREQKIAGETYHYEVLEEGKPAPGPVLRVYGMALAAVVPALFAFLRMDTVNRLVGDKWGMLVTLATLVWGVFVMTRFVNADKAFKATAEAAPAAANAG
jgi:hypothetical protein